MPRGKKTVPDKRKEWRGVGKFVLRFEIKTAK